MNIRSRITVSTVLGLALAGLCLSSAQAQSGMKSKSAKHQNMMHDSSAMDDSMMDDYNAPVPNPIGYPFAAPGGLHLYHYTDFSHEKLAPDSAYSQMTEDRWKRERKLRDRERMYTDGMTIAMVDPEPIRYPFAAPGGLHLYHWTDYSRTTLAPMGASEKRMDNEDRRQKMLRDRDRMYSDSMLEDNMVDPEPIRYPFAAPGGLHLYHWTDYSRNTLAPESASEKRMENEDKMEAKRAKRMKQNQQDPMNK